MRTLDTLIVSPSLRVAQEGPLDYFLKNDPDLQAAIREEAWDAFLLALSETTPEIIKALKDRPLKTFSELADGYKTVCGYPFGTITCHVDGKAALTAHPFADLAMLLCSPHCERDKPGWPPAVPFWDPSLRASILAISAVMKQWAKNFTDLNGNPHFKLVAVALGTMHTWMVEPNLLTQHEWFGQSKVIRSTVYQTQQYGLPIDGWNPTKETEAEFKTRVKGLAKNLGVWARKHISETKALFVNYDSKRNREHYTWTALRLARQLTYPEILEVQKQVDLDDATVRKGVKAVLKTLGLRDVVANRK
jgi:hypothetical protein